MSLDLHRIPFPITLSSMHFIWLGVHLSPLEFSCTPYVESYEMLNWFSIAMVCSCQWGMKHDSMIQVLRLIVLQMWWG